MLGSLNDEKVEELLRTELLGRIGCHDNGLTYIVPVHYAYEPPYIYAHSAEGLKISMMRNNPQVCFEIDLRENYFNWQSVICWGEFEEVTDIHESARIMQLIINRVEPFLQKVQDSHPSHGITDAASDIGITKEIIIYRIRLNKKNGRFEKQELAGKAEQEIS